MNAQLLEYIEECIKRKIPEETFRAALISKGWNLQEVDEAIEYVKKTSPAIVHGKILYTVLSAAAIFVAVFLIILGILSSQNEKIDDQIITSTSSLQENVEDYSKNKIELNLNISNCVDDMWCFIYSATLCEPANVEYDVISSVQEKMVINKYFYEILEEQIEGCALNISLLKQTPSLTEGMFSNIGKSGICVFSSNEELVSVLTKIRDGEFSGGASCTYENDWDCVTFGDFESAECFGELFLEELESESSDSVECTTSNDCDDGYYCKSNMCVYSSSKGGGLVGGSQKTSKEEIIEEDHTPEPQPSEEFFLVRSFSSEEISPQEIVTVTLTKIFETDHKGLLIEEIFPEGWTINDAGTGFVNGNYIRWAEISEVELGNLTYELIAPDYSGSWQWEGIYAVDGADSTEIAGKNTVVIV